jgi:dienelactone hydrolase
MAHVALFHSMLGLRPVERLAAERLRQSGHLVTTPDLYDGRTASNMGDGFSLMNDIGWPEITRLARDAMLGMPAEAVLMGFSMGVGVVGTLWPQRRETAAVVLIHALCPLPVNARQGLRLQVHAGEADTFAPPTEAAALLTAATEAGVRGQMFAYPDAGHFYTDASLPDYNADATELTWRRILDGLG